MASHYVSELSGLQQIAPNAKVDFIEGLSLDPSTSARTTTDATGNEVRGMKVEYFSNTNWSGDAAVTRTEKHVDWTGPTTRTCRSKATLRRPIRTPPKVRALAS